MKFFTLLILLICSEGLFAQTFTMDPWSWDEIIITDSKSGWSSWDNNYQIDRKTLNLVLVGEKDSILGKVDSTMIVALFKSFETPKNVHEDPLLMFGKDSVWFLNNSKELWANYMKDRKLTSNIDEFVYEKLKKYSSYKDIIWNMQGEHWTDDYPVVQLKITSQADTLIYHSFGQYPFMLPWDGSMEIYNSDLPIAIGTILPNNEESNKNRLLGEYFEHILMDEIHKKYLRLEIEKAKIKKPFS